MAAPLPLSLRYNAGPPRRLYVISNAVCLERRSTAAVSQAPKKKVLVPVGMGTEEIEAVVLTDVLRRAGAEVFVASVETKLEVEGSSGTKIVADAPIGDYLGETFDLVVLPGGMPGATRLRDCEILQKITCKQAEENRLYGAICAAPAVVLKPWGLLRRKQITGHPAFMDKLPTFWAVKSNIQVSGELTTSRGPGTTIDFAISLVEQLLGTIVSDEIKEQLLFSISDGSPRKEELNSSDWSLSHNPRVLVPVANGCEGMEVVTIVDILRRAKVDVVIASAERSTKILTAQNSTLIADKSLSAAADSIYDLIILPGGAAGAERLHKSRVLRKMLKDQKLGGRVNGAVSSSLAVLQKQGLLTNEKVVDYTSGEGAGVIVDGKMITSKGLGTAIDLSLAIVGKFFGHARARSVAEGIVYEYPRQQP